MTRKITGYLPAFAALIMLACPTTVVAAGPAVLQVVAIELDGSEAAWLDKVKEVDPIIERLGLPGYRIWQATLAGPNTGAIFVAIEAADLTAFASNQAKLQGDEEWQKWLEELNQSGISTTVSNSLLVEITP